jgi:hypothetical protein
MALFDNQYSVVHIEQISYYCEKLTIWTCIMSLSNWFSY